MGQPSLIGLYDSNDHGCPCSPASTSANASRAGALGCDEVQGVALGAPMPGEQMHRLVVERIERETLGPVCAS